MYGHEVIKSLRNNFKRLSFDNKIDNKIFLNYTNRIIKDIQNSMHFHMGGNDSYTFLRSKYDKEKMFLGPINVKLPYSLCWFDTNVLTNDGLSIKMGILVRNIIMDDNHDGFEISCAFKLKGIWYLSRIMITGMWW